MRIEEQASRVVLTQGPAWHGGFFRKKFWRWLLPIVAVVGAMPLVHDLSDWAKTLPDLWRWIVLALLGLGLVLFSLLMLAENRDRVIEIDRTSRMVTVRRPWLLGTRERRLALDQISQIDIVEHPPRLRTGGGDTAYAIEAKLKSGESVELTRREVERQELDAALQAAGRVLK